MRALVTGASGFVGQHLVHHLLSCGDEVIGAIKPGQSASLPIEQIPLDVTDSKSVLYLVGDVKPDVIYHLAGIAFVPSAEEDFSQALLVNVGGTNNVFRAAHLLDRGIKVIFVSSAEVYGRVTPKDIPVNESVPFRPANNYSLSKRMAELVADRYLNAGQISGVIMRPFNHIGAGQSNQFVASSFAWQLSQIAKGKREAVIKVGNLTPKRDFSDVRDIVSAYRLAAEKGSGVYNLGSGKAFEIQEILDTLIQISGLDVKIEQDPSRMRPSEVPTLYVDNSKAKQELGWTPMYSLKESLQEVYNYWNTES